MLAERLALGTKSCVQSLTMAKLSAYRFSLLLQYWQSDVADGVHSLVHFPCAYTNAFGWCAVDKNAPSHPDNARSPSPEGR